MAPFSVRRLGILVLAGALAGLARAEEPPIIAKARAFLGSEAALNGIHSIQFNGTITTTDPSAPDKTSNATIEIIAQKPDKQRVVATSSRGVETTTLDGYEAWQRFQDAANPKNQRLVVLKPDALKRLRAQAFENLSFFRGLDRQGGRIEDQGTTEIDGITCQKIAFIHPNNVVFIRYFEVATGRLVRTDSDDGGVTREEGEQRVGGVRFPKGMKMTIKTAKGDTQLVTIAFDSIKLNETYPDAVFRMPSPSAP